ncbi:MAG: flagellar biosynthetic protein FliO [Rahnella inusitata]|jgi:flagellar protein FliO/FliZ|uniref:Flagellar protein n=1 Tax=Rahnella inusitata TaxID=58169 RepID=A0ABX9P5J7_9GAMM|nr:flagellar biosynthetic protein FliO [Rahnella inusitata]QUT13320.1 flagellar biosynthetic protein FliO [Rahnella inusitata]RJT16280.1 flagellar biosynthetic protein FliO [Rahnella inusitata]
MNQNAATDSPYISGPANHATTQASAPVVPASSVLTQVSSVLGGILLLILFIGWVAKRTGLAPQAKNNKLLKITSSCQVGRSEKVVIVEVDNTWLVLGVTAHSITPLHTLSAPPVDTPAVSAAELPADFRQLMQKMLKRPGKQA